MKVNTKRIDGTVQWHGPNGVFELACFQTIHQVQEALDEWWQLYNRTGDPV